MVIMDSLTGTLAQDRRAATAFVARVCPWADLDAVILVVSELVTNAVRHTTGWRQHVVSALASRVEIIEHPDGKTIRATWLRPAPGVTPA
jgi:hypothetical protein